MPTTVDTIYGLGDDQRASQFIARFSNIPGSTNDIKNVSLRIDQSFDIPGITSGEYEFFHKGEKIVRSSMVNEQDKHLSLQVRVDQEWEVFDDLYAWKKICHDPATTSKGEFAERFCSVLSIDMLNHNNESAKLFELRYCELKEITISSVDPASNDPTRLTLNIIFGEIVPS